MSVSRKIEKSIVFLGGEGVGKTQILKRLEGNIFEEHYSATIGASLSRLPCRTDDLQFRLSVCDTAGQKRFASLTQWYLKNKHGYVFVVDGSRRLHEEKSNSTLQSQYAVLKFLKQKTDENLQQEFAKNSSSVSSNKKPFFILVVNKIDIEPQLLLDTDIDILVKEFGFDAVVNFSAKNFTRKDALKPGSLLSVIANHSAKQERIEHKEDKETCIRSVNSILNPIASYFSPQSRVKTHSSDEVHSCGDDFASYLKSAQERIIDDIRKDIITEKEAALIANQLSDLSLMVANCTVTADDVDKFYKKIKTPVAKSARLGRIIGAIIGVILGIAFGLIAGAMIGALTGPGAALTALGGGATGAVVGAAMGASLGASLGGAFSAYLGGRLSIWRHPLSSIEKSARQLATVLELKPAASPSPAQQLGRPGAGVDS